MIYFKCSVCGNIYKQEDGKPDEIMHDIDGLKIFKSKSTCTCDYCVEKRDLMCKYCEKAPNPCMKCPERGSVSNTECPVNCIEMFNYVKNLQIQQEKYCCKCGKMLVGEK